jgi:hypothetical protein
MGRTLALYVKSSVLFRRVSYAWVISDLQEYRVAPFFSVRTLLSSFECQVHDIRVPLPQTQVGPIADKVEH